MFPIGEFSTFEIFMQKLLFGKALLDRRQANLCFHFAGSGENLPDIASNDASDASMDNKEFSSLLQILMKQNNFLF